LQQSRKLAERSEVAGADVAARVAEMYRIALGRTPAKEEIDLGVQYVQGEAMLPAGSALAEVSPWKYGYGEFDESTGRMASFYPLPQFTGTVWQGGEKLPDQKLGWAMLSAEGGHAGNTLQTAVVRRWTAPRDCTVTVDGTLSHKSKEGDGVRARLVTSREGLLASWNVHHKSADTKVAELLLKQGDTVDFIVDCGRAGDFGFDGFTWKVTVTKESPVDQVAGDDTGSWDSASEFAGPAPKPAAPLSPWEKYAQVLLESNEFAFVD
ncbi:MAG: hypothetical protein ABI039_01405, partial [Vicinamibacterales bacterium]